MENEFSFKELYDVFLKATYNMEINGRTYQPGETIALFDKVQSANLSSDAKRVHAHGGHEDRNWVTWETVKEGTLQFTQGIFNRTQFGLMLNARVLELVEDQLDLPTREVVESDENSTIKLTHAALGSPFIYKEDSGELVAATGSGDTFIVPAAYTNYIVDYNYAYTNKFARTCIGSALSEGCFTLVGKTKTKDDITGQVRTGILEIPKLKLTSNLSITLGKNANPVVGRFIMRALPYGDYGNSCIMNMFFLEDDIDSDIQ